MHLPKPSSPSEMSNGSLGSSHFFKKQPRRKGVFLPCSTPAEDGRTAVLGNLMGRVIRKTVPRKLLGQEFLPQGCGGMAGRGCTNKAQLVFDRIPVWLQKALGRLQNT